MRKRFRAMAAILAAAMLVPLAGCGAADGRTRLTFQIWDVYQRDAMQAICDAYTANVNPNVVIEVQVTSWNEYWTKLEAAAESNTMPDIFWMHTNQLLYYADFGMLADMTDLYSDVDPDYYTQHFSQISLDNARASDGRMYGVPKDKDNIVMVYNREMFDRAGVPYPDENWTWDDLVSASQRIYDATGKYGYLAYNDDQVGYWNFVYQAGGHILSADKTRAGFTNPGTRKAMEFYVGLQRNDWCPDQAYFAETSPQTAFFSQVGAMYFEGNWNLLPMMENYPDMVGKWDIAPLPACPDPMEDEESLDVDGRATISNGLCYSTAAHGRNLEAAKDVLKYFGTEEAQRIQGSYGAAMSAYIGLEDVWGEAFDRFPYQLDVDVVTRQFDYSVQSVNNAARPKWKSPVLDELTKVYNGRQELDACLDNMQRIVDEATAASLADSERRKPRGT